jgi:molybdopterin converting factor small subunit
LELVVEFYAAVRDSVGCSAATISVPPATSVRKLRQELLARWPDAANVFMRCSYAVNELAASDDVVLGPGDRVAVLPPVSGG